MSEMAAHALTVTLEGSEANGGDVLLGGLRTLCASLADCLKRVEGILGGAPRLDYRITGLRRGSAALRLVPNAGGADAARGGEVFRLLDETVSNLEAGREIDGRLTGEDLRCFKGLLRSRGSGIRSVRINRTTLTGRFRLNVVRLLAESSESEGSASGILGKIDLHRKSEFTLYPVLGDPIACRFDAPIFPRVRDALSRSVTVRGRMVRYRGRPFPERAYVTGLEVNPPDDELPRLSELRGAMKGAFGEGSSAEFTRKLRDG